MKRKLLIAAAILVILLVAAAALAPFLVDVNDFRPRIEEALAGATGREVELGELSFSLLPAPSLQAGGVTIGEDPQFGTGPFLRSGALAVRVSLFPLLAGTLEIGRVTIQSPEIRVTRGSRGWNVSTLLGGPAGSAPAEAAGAQGASAAKAPAPAPGEESVPGPAVVIQDLRLDGGSLVFRDAALRPEDPIEIQVREIDLELSGISSEAPMRLRLALTLGGSGSLRVDGTLEPAPPGGSGLSVDLRVAGERVEVARLAPYLESFTGIRAGGGELGLELDVSGSLPDSVDAGGSLDLAGVPVEPFAGDGPPVVLDAALEVKGGRREGVTTVDRGDLVVNGTPLAVTGSLTESGESLRVDAAIRAEGAGMEGILPVLSLMGPVVPRGLGRTGSVSLDARVTGRLDRLEELSFSGKASLKGLEYQAPFLRQPVREIGGSLDVAEDGAAVEGLSLSLGRSRLEGKCRIRGFDAPVVEVNLSAPMLDVDELLAITSPAKGAGAAASRAARPALQVAGMAAPPASPRRAAAASGSALPGLESLTVRGSLAAAEARLLNLTLSSFKARVSMEGGRARISEAALSLYGGSFGGDITAAFDRSGPPFTVDASLKGVDFDSMAADFSPDLGGLLHGTLDAGLRLSGQGLARPQLKKNLEGDATFSLVDGRLTTVGVLKDLAKALEAAGGRGIGQEETPFSYLGGTFRIKGDKVRTEDLTLESQDIVLKGEGRMTMDLGLDLDLTARIAPEVSAAMVAQRENLRFLEDKKDRIRLDLRVDGSLMEPGVGVDPEMIRRVMKNAARERIGKGLKNLLKGDDD